MDLKRRVHVCHRLWFAVGHANTRNRSDTFAVDTLVPTRHPLLEYARGEVYAHGHGGAVWCGAEGICSWSATSSLVKMKRASKREEREKK